MMRPSVRMTAGTGSEQDPEANVKTAPGVDAVTTLPSGGEATCASYSSPASCWGTTDINTSKTQAKEQEKRFNTTV